MKDWKENSTFLLRAWIHYLYLIFIFCPLSGSQIFICHGGKAFEGVFRLNAKWIFTTRLWPLDCFVFLLVSLLLRLFMNWKSLCKCFPQFDKFSAHAVASSPQFVPPRKCCLITSTPVMSHNHTWSKICFTFSLNIVKQYLDPHKKTSLL